MKRLARFLSVFILSIVFVGVGRAQVPALYSVDSDTDLIYELHPLTGAVVNSFSTPVASHKPAAGGPDGLAFDGMVLYYTSGNASETGTGETEATNRTIYFLNPGTGAVIDTWVLPIATAPGAMSQAIDALATDGSLLYANRPADRQIFVLDPATKTIVRTVSLPFAEIGGMGYNPWSGTLFVSDSSTFTVHEVDPATGASLSTLDFSPAGGILGIDFVRNKMYVSLSSTPDIIEVSPVSGIEINRFAAPGSFTAALAGRPGFPGPCRMDALYSVNSSASTISAINPNTGAVLRTFLAPVTTNPPGGPPSLGGPEGLAFDGSVLYYISGDHPNPAVASRVFKVDPCSGVVVGSVVPALPAPGVGVDATIDGLAFGRAFGSPTLFALRPATQEIFALDPGTGAVNGTVALPFPVVGGLGYHNHRQTLFVSDFNASPSVLHEVEPGTGGVLATHPMPPGDLLGVDFVGTRLFAALDDASGTIIELDLAGMVLNTFSSPDFMPSALAGRPARPEDCGFDCFDLFRVDVPGGKIWKLGGAPRRGEFGPAVHPDGSGLAYVGIDGGSSRVFVAGFGGPGLGPETRVPGTMEATDPAWNADGSRLAFVDTRDDELFEIRIPEFGRRRLLRPGAIEPAYSPTGVCVAFKDAASGDLVVRNLRTDAEFVVATPASSPAWAPDGSKLAFEQAGDLHMVNMRGAGCRMMGRIRRLTNAPAFEGKPSFSPDGTMLAFQSDRGDWMAIWTIPVAGGKPTLAGGIPGFPNLDPVWAPDGTGILFSGFSLPGDFGGSKRGIEWADASLGAVQGVDDFGVETEDAPVEAGEEAELGIEAYPNPFNPVTTLRFSLPESASVRLAVFDMLGRQVRLLVDESLVSGTHEVHLDAHDLPSGLYLYRLQAGSDVRSGRLTLIK